MLEYDYSCIFFCVNDFILQYHSEQNVRKCYLTVEVATDFIYLFHKIPTIVLLSCDFIADALVLK